VDAVQLLTELKRTWEQTKETVDQMRAEMLAHNTVDAETAAKFEKQNSRLDELETKLNRTPLISTGGAEDTQAEVRERKRIFFETLRRGSVAALEDEDRAKARELKIGPVGAKEAKALALGDDTLGGFLAPPEYVQEIIKGVQLISPFRDLARVRPTTRRSVQLPVRSGVFAAQWIGETSTRTETTGLTYSLEEVPTYEMYAEIIVSEQDLEDSAFDLEGEIRDNAMEQFAKAEGAAFINGDSQKKPEGISTNTNVQSVLSGAAGLIAGAAGNTGGPIITLAYSLKSDYVPGAAFLMRREVQGAVRQLTDSQGRYLWEPNLQVGQPATLLGIPIREMPDLPLQGASNFPIFLGNFKRGYTIVDRVDVVVKRLNEKYAEQGQIAFIVRKRVGGQVVLPEAMWKLKSNNS